MSSQLNENNVAEFVGQMVDILEDYLETKGVTPDMLKNPEKGDDEDAAIIFGSDYDIIDDAVRTELDLLDLVGRPDVNLSAANMKLAVDHIYESYEEVVEKVDGYDLDDTDERYLKNEIRQTFVNWEVFV